MRIIRIVVVILAMLAMIIPYFASASELPNTETNTNSTLLFFSDFLSPEVAHAQEGLLLSPATVDKPKTDEEIKNELILAKWKVKQAEKWEKLSNEPFEINASAYTAAADECDKSDGVTASGIVAKSERTIACPPEFPFGTKIKIENVGTFVCEDRGGAIKGNRFDIFMNTKKEAFQFGRQHLVAQVVQ